MHGMSLSVQVELYDDLMQSPFFKLTLHLVGKVWQIIQFFLNYRVLTDITQVSMNLLLDLVIVASLVSWHQHSTSLTITTFEVDQSTSSWVFRMHPEQLENYRGITQRRSCPMSNTKVSFSFCCNIKEMANPKRIQSMKQHLICWLYQSHYILCLEES